MIKYEDIQEGDLIELDSPIHKGKFVVISKFVAYNGLEFVEFQDVNGQYETFSINYLNNNLATLERSGKIDKVGEKSCPIIVKGCAHVWVEDKWFIKTYKTCKECGKKWEDM